MTSRTITDRAGDTLRLSTGSLTAGPGEITVKVTERFRGREAVAAVHVDPVALRAALDEVAPAGSYTRTESPDLLDGGMMCAAIEAEAASDTLLLVQQQRDQATARAEKAEQERDHARRERDSWRAQVPLADWEKELVQHSEQSRPLTPDAISADDYERGVPRLRAALDYDMSPLMAHEVVRDIVAAVLAEPPARPEWEEEGAKALTVAVWGMEIPSEAGEAGDKLAFSLARHGYKVVPVSAEEQP